jgi:hypothetical protein
MPLFSSRPPADGLEGILHLINIGESDDSTVRALKPLVEQMSGDDVKSLADILMTNLVKYPDDISVLMGSIKALETLPYLPQAKNEFIITLLLSLLKAPPNHKDATRRKSFKREIIKFLLFFISQDDEYATHMMPELISALDEDYGPPPSGVFQVLQRLASDKPEYFQDYSTALIKQLGSINKSTRAESAKLIGIIARQHPEYVMKAMPFLQSLASFYPDINVKRNANEAYQIIHRSMKDEPSMPVMMRRANVEGKGLADIMKVNAGSPVNKARATQFTDDELKDIIELTRKEFKSDAESILNSLGVGHLAINVKDGKPKHKTAPVIPGGDEAPPVLTPKPRKPAPQEKTFSMEKEDPAFNLFPQSGIIKTLKRESKEAVPQKSAPSKPVQFTCPICGGEAWANGQLCDKCAGAEFDKKATRGHP